MNGAAQKGSIGVKLLRRLLIVTLLAVGLFILSNWQALSTQFTYYQTAITGLLTHQETRKADNYQTNGYILRNPKDATTKTGADDTPVESAVQGVLLQQKYYYHYATGTPVKARAVFTEAVKLYNQPGIVQLTEGPGSTTTNRITFGVYHHKETGKKNTIELGHGGPQITQRISWQGILTTNTATAKLNATYPQSFKQSVAVHELGHALGLDHSSDKTSVMTPIDQGRTQLSTADLKSLRAIYDKG